MVNWIHAKSCVKYLVPERTTPRHHLAKKYLKSTEKSACARSTTLDGSDRLSAQEMLEYFKLLATMRCMYVSVAMK